MVLQAYPDGSPHEPEAGVALIHHRVPVTEAVAADVTIHDGVRGATVAGWKVSKTNKDMRETASSVNAPHSRQTTGAYYLAQGAISNSLEYTRTERV